MAWLCINPYVQPTLAVHCVAHKEEPFNCGVAICERMGHEMPEVVFDSGEHDIEDPRVRQLDTFLHQLCKRGFELVKLPCGAQAIGLGSSKPKRHRAARLALALSVSMKSDDSSGHIGNESDSDPLVDVARRAKKLRHELADLHRSQDGQDAAQSSSARPTKRTRYTEL